MEFDEAVCTGVAWDGARLIGTLTTANRRGEEKVRCLEALRAQHPGLSVVAYGTAACDLPHLRLAKRGVLVNGSRVLSGRRCRGRFLRDPAWG